MKLLIVDDEAYTREGLVEELACKKYGFTEIMQAQDGEMALKIAKWFRPDVVITDIRMPGMDGIAFAEDLKRFSDDCRLIFMSGYMELEYLKSAIELQAVSFVEKPIDDRKLEEAISKAVQQIQENRQKKRLTEEKEVWRRKKLARMISCRNPDRDEVERISRELEWKRQYCYNTAMLIEKEVRYTPDEICDLVEKYFESKGYRAICDYMDKCTYMVVLAYMPQKEKALTRDMKYFPVKWPTFAIGAGIQVSNIMQVYTSLETAQRALNEFFYLPQQNYFELNEAVLHHRTLDPKIYMEYIEVYRKQPEKLKEWLGNFYGRIEEQHTYPKSQIQRLFNSFAMIILKDHPGLYKGIPGVYNETDIENLFAATFSLRETEEILDGIVEGFLKKYEEDHQYSYIIRNVLDYIAAHFQEADFMVQTLADSLHFSPTYLNILFKKEMNVSLKQYISEYRIAQAKKLLENEFYKIADIAEMCGYTSANYFTKAFKEGTGVSPQDYRQKVREHAR